MHVERLVVGQLQTNCYLVWDKETQKAIIIDPGDDGDFILRRIQDFNLEPDFIIATHGHFDHVLAVTELKLALNIPFLMHKTDLFLLKRARQTAKFFQGVEADPDLPVEKFIKEGDLVKFGNEKLRVIETPGHSPGGVSLFDRGVLFSGDTLFAQGVGRTDYSYGSEENLKNSLKKLLNLPQDTHVYPGHGQKTSVENEKMNYQSLFESV